MSKDNENKLVMKEQLKKGKNAGLIDKSGEIITGVVGTGAKITSGFFGSLGKLGSRLTEKSNKKNAKLFKDIKESDIINALDNILEDSENLVTEEEDGTFIDSIQSVTNYISDFFTSDKELKPEHKGKTIQDIIIEKQLSDLEDEQSTLVTETPEIQVNQLTESENLSMENAVYNNRKKFRIIEQEKKQLLKLKEENK